MKRLLNTLFVTSEDVYLALDGETVAVRRENNTIGRFPLHNLEGIVCFSYAGASPALMGACAERGVDLSFCTPRGKFLARTTGITNGNVLLRREQYRVADDLRRSCVVAKNMIFGKLYNCRWSMERTKRDHGLRINTEVFEKSCAEIRALLPQVLQAESMEALRGFEGAAATIYFQRFDDMILREKDLFFFRERNRRPPCDKVNAMLSFAYSLLARECASALESVGLDSYVGFLHRDRPGRRSLALDLMEEFRGIMVDRFVLTLINKKIMKEKYFIRKENDAVIMTDEGRKVFLSAWQSKKQETIKHPFLDEKIEWGMAPYVQSMLLARYLRGDLDEYPPFFWK